MNMIRVLLRRPWRTPYGRFPKSIDGEPTLIPMHVIRRMEVTQNPVLPSDAKMVGDDYLPPRLREPDEEQQGGSMSPKQMEAMVNKLAEEKAREMWNERMKNVAEVAGKKAEAEAEKEPKEPEPGSSLLDNSVSEIQEELSKSKLGRDSLLKLKDAEENGRKRKGVLIAVDAALEDLSDTAA